LWRGGIDYGSYLHQIALWDLFRAGPGDISVWRGILLALSLPVRYESDLADSVAVIAGNTDVRLVFDRACYRFTTLEGYNDFLLQELRMIALPRHVAFVDTFSHAFVGINIRCGNDFKAPPIHANYDRVGWLQRTPISWYAESLLAIRAACGYPVAAVVVSDGREEILRDILSLENVTFLRPGRAITDLLVLTQSRVLLATASSSFSAWASFLGGMPTISAPGHPLTEWDVRSTPDRFVGNFDPKDPPSGFLTQAVARMSAFR